MTKLSHGWLRPNLEARVGAHVHAWEAIRKAGPTLSHEQMAFITLSREFGCEAIPLSLRLAEILNERCRPTIPWVAYDKEVLDRVAQELHLHRSVVESLDGHRRDEMSELFHAILNVKVDEALVFRKMAEVIRSLALHGHAILVGRGSHLITQDLRTGLHVRLVAPCSWRAHRLASDRQVSHRDAEKIIAQGEKEREHYLRTFFAQDPAHPFHHDLVVDNSRFNLDQIAEIIFTALGARFGETLLACS